jgi:2-polyprenyl-3-methyl-5-hydroxy-6-metoxy-1,4-benzoquinol methylase
MAAWARVDSFTGNRLASDLMVQRPCPLCGGEPRRTLLELNGFQYHLDSATAPKRVDVRTVQCEACGIAYQDAVLTPEGYAVVMAEAEASFGASPGRADEEVDWMRERGLLGGGRRVLDVGCHDGGLLAQMPAEDARIGVDVDERAVARGAAAHPGIRFLHSPFERVEVEGAVDTFTMFHVLEHLPRPVEALRRLAGLAAPGGRLVVEVPIAENGATNDISGFFSVYHVTHFTRGGLQRALAAAGWAVEEWCEMDDYNGCRVVASRGAGEAAVSADGAYEDCLAAWRESAAHADERLADIGPRCVVWGAGSHTEMLYHATSFFRADREYRLVDRDPAKIGGTWRGIPISGPDEIGANVPLVASSYQGQPAIVAEARERGVDEVVALYDDIRVH